MLMIDWFCIVAQGETKAAAAAAGATTHQENGAVTMTQQSVKPDKNVDADSLSSFSDGNDEPKQCKYIWLSVCVHWSHPNCL